MNGMLAEKLLRRNLQPRQPPAVINFILFENSYMKVSRILVNIMQHDGPFGTASSVCKTL